MGFVSSMVGKVLGTGSPTEANMIQQDNLTQHADQGYDQNQTLAQALQQQALTGGGPQATIFQNQLGQANNQAASLIASQKGINPGLAARLAGQQVSQNNQGALGQAAQMQMGAQQLASQNNLQQQSITQGAINANNQANASIAAGNNNNNATGVGGLMNGLSGAISNIAKVAAPAAGMMAGGPLGGAMGAGMMAAAHGAVVPGQAQVSGDSSVNDTVPAMLSPGEIVVPRSVAKDPDKIKEFVEHLTASKSARGPKGFAKVLDAHRKLGKLLESAGEEE